MTPPLDEIAPPEPPPRASGWLHVSDGHVLWWEESGPPDGAPAVVVHGGPGAGLNPRHRRLFDLARQRVISFDQRGCGRSTPRGATAANTTAHLVADMERLRRDRGVERWLVAGGSWGSTLALAYAQAHLERVSALVVSGVFLARPVDLDWWWEGARAFLPEAFAARDAWLPYGERADVRAAFLSRILDPDPEVSAPAAAVLAGVEARMLRLRAPGDDLAAGVDADAVEAMRLFAHYAANAFFLRPDQLLADAHRLRDVPGAIVAGSHDLCTPPRSAFDLQRAWPLPTFHYVADGGHRWSDVALSSALQSIFLGLET